MSLRQAVETVQTISPSRTDIASSTESHKSHATRQTLSLFRSISAAILSAWKWMEAKRIQQVANRRIRVAETVSLGEKRFVSIIQVDGTQFLIGGTTGSISLLAVLDKEDLSAKDWQRRTATASGLS